MIAAAIQGEIISIVYDLGIHGLRTLLCNRVCSRYNSQVSKLRARVRRTPERTLGVSTEVQRHDGKVDNAQVLGAVDLSKI